VNIRLGEVIKLVLIFSNLHKKKLPLPGKRERATVSKRTVPSHLPENLSAGISTVGGVPRVAEVSKGRSLYLSG
jgi:hypothetical protein